MAEVNQIYGTQRKVGALVGIELEVEGERLPQGDFVHWDVKPDGSLRNGMEYVFKEAKGSLNTRAALKEFKDALTTNRTITDYSFRTSTHVHVNVSNLDIEVVKVMACLFTLFEDEYINYCAKSRKANRFCLGIKDAEGVVDNLATFIRRDSVPSPDIGKYSAMNLCTLSRFGTLEFRCLEGTSDTDRIYLWVRALLSLRKAAKTVETTSALFKMNKAELAELLFPTPKLKASFLKEGWEKRVAYNESVAYAAFTYARGLR